MMYRSIGIALLVTSLAYAETASSPVTSAAISPAKLTAEEEAELAALLATQATWERSFTLRGSVGARDNVLLSSFAPIHRGFVQAELESFFWRPMRDSWEAIAFVDGEVLRFFAPPPEISGEAEWFAHGEIRWQPIEPARLALKADGFFQDTVIDLSETETVRLAAPTRTYGGFATAAARLSLPGGFSFEPQFQLKRTDYREFPGDYDETATGARLEWKRHDGLRFSVGGVERQRRYDERTQYTVGGRALPGTRLRFRQREADVKVLTTWGSTVKWTAAATAGWLENRDRASGYFDYDQRRARLELGWQHASWKITFAGEAKRMKYRTQTVGAGIAPPPRRADTFETSVRIERELSATWLSFAEHRWERERSNETDFNYRANTVLAGVQRTF